MKRGYLLWMLLVIALAITNRFAQDRRDCCAFDGQKISPVYRVDLVRSGEVVASFCCIQCACDWPELVGDFAWKVRDEVSGEVIDSTVALFVKNKIFTVASRRDAVHVLRNPYDAIAYIERHGGKPVSHPLPLPKSEAALAAQQSETIVDP